MQYEIFVRYTRDDMLRTVREYIANGWEPLGGIAVVAAGRGEREFYQAMTCNIRDIDS